ncbi:MAG: DUF1631 family protein [bacterium]|nr:DUF1631 family protein [Gammaproteobacteria bacterium]
MSEPTLQTLSGALRSHYTPPKPNADVWKEDALITMLRSLSSLSVEKNIDPILVQIQKYHPGTSLSENDYAILAYVDDCITQILTQTDLDYQIEALIRGISPLVALVVIQQDVRAIMRPQQVLTLIDMLVTECVGWSEDLGVLGQQFIARIDDVVSDLINNRKTLEDCQTRLTRFFEKERKLNGRMEERLCNTEFEALANQKAQYYSAELLNQHMCGKQLPLFTIVGLQGSWYEFLQQVFTHYGQKSKQWTKANQLTQALVWSIHPQKNKRKQETVIAQLPGMITKFTKPLIFDTKSVEQCLEEFDSEYEAIREKKPSPLCDFDPLEIDEKMQEDRELKNPATQKTLEAFKEGQWFFYDDTTESGEKTARIRLVLNWRDTDRLFFTNQNRRKILQMSYHEMAKHLSAKTLKPLNPKRSVVDIIKSHFSSVLKKVQTQKQKETGSRKPQDRRKVVEDYFADRRKQLRQEKAQRTKRAEFKQKRANTLRRKATRKMAVASRTVDSLELESWVKLPVMIGVLTPCKLVSKVGDKYTFANRAGIKVAEYTSRQLSQLFVTENSEILDTGSEFERVLAQVVTGLRESQYKTFDQLSGTFGGNQAADRE